MNVMAVSCLLLVLTFCSVLNVAAVTLAHSPLLWHAGFSALCTSCCNAWTADTALQPSACMLVCNH